jgi:hypothetical protein
MNAKAAFWFEPARWIGLRNRDPPLNKIKFRDVFRRSEAVRRLSQRVRFMRREDIDRPAGSCGADSAIPRFREQEPAG